MSEAELTVQEATTNETWGPTGQVLNKLADYAYADHGKARDIVNALLRKLNVCAATRSRHDDGSLPDALIRPQERGDNWRQCYKALLVIEYLCKTGPMDLVQEVSSVHISPSFVAGPQSDPSIRSPLLTLQFQIRRDVSGMLRHISESFEYKDARGHDQGANVRARAKHMLNLLNNDEQLDMERENALRNRVGAGRARNPNFPCCGRSFPARLVSLTT